MEIPLKKIFQFAYWRVLWAPEKTTLLNYILKGQQGKHIAVIESEFGDAGIDKELVIEKNDEIFEMENGCICCSIRSDLIETLNHLMKKQD